MNQTVNFLKELVAIPSPTGYTKDVQDYLIDVLKDMGYEPTRTAKGLVVVTVPGVIDEQQRVVTAHIDTLGAIVRAVKPDGRLKLDRIGGFAWNMIEGENCTVHVASNGTTVSGTILLTLLKKYKSEGITLPVTTHFMFSCIEETGTGANSSIPEKAVEFLAVDMGARGDDQQTDEYTVSVCVKDGSGPYNFDFRQHLVSLCKEQNIPFKLDIYPYYGSDASAAMRAGAEVKHALLGAGIESSHSYERTHLDSVEATQQLVDAYLLSSLVEA